VNTPRGIIQFVPRLGVQSDGVADYARTLAAALSAGERIDTWFLQGDPTGGSGDDSRAERSARVAERSAAKVVEALEARGGGNRGGQPANVLVHYANYGFARRGCPFWLVDGLEQWKRHNPRARLVVMFHELYALGPPWRSSFWLSPLQRHLARDLWRLSDEVVTNREQSRQWLCHGQTDTGRRMSVMPVFSTLGEPEQLTPWGERSAQMVIAGRSGAADRAYGRRRDQLVEACRALDIDEIVDLGARSDPVPTRIGNIRVSALGHLSPAQASTVLANAKAGFIDYPSDYLGKSTVFAAYAAHGLVPVVSWHRGEEEAGLQEGENYWVPTSGGRTPRDFEAISRQATAWYAGHSLDFQTREYAKLLWGRLD
jgi:hypothetical protein